LIEQAPQVITRFERLDVLVNGCERRELEPLGQFLIAGTVAIVFNEIRDEVEHFLLPLGQSHDTIVRRTKGEVKGYCGIHNIRKSDGSNAGYIIAASTTPPSCMQTHLHEYGFRYNRRDRGYLTFWLIFGWVSKRAVD
jgi:hypothetical protein